MTTPDHPLSEPGPESSAEALQELADQQLLEVIADTNTRLELLHTEIARRTREGTEKDLQADQRAEISRLVEHLEQAKIDWRKVWEFFRCTFIEARSRDPWGASTALREHAPDDADGQDRQ